VVAITGDDGSSGTITPRDWEKVWFGDDPDCYFANFSAHHFANKWWQTDTWQNSALIFWHIHILAKCYFGKRMLWRNDILAK
jgi:hypothetical protein